MNSEAQVKAFVSQVETANEENEELTVLAEIALTIGKCIGCAFWAGRCLKNHPCKVANSEACEDFSAKG